jgi:hypothetical protein
MHRTTNRPGPSIKALRRRPPTRNHQEKQRTSAAAYLVLFDTNNRILGPYLANIHKILTSVMDQRRSNDQTLFVASPLCSLVFLQKRDPLFVRVFTAVAVAVEHAACESSRRTAPEMKILLLVVK